MSRFWLLITPLRSGLRFPLLDGRARRQMLREFGRSYAVAGMMFTVCLVGGTGCAGSSDSRRPPARPIVGEAAQATEMPRLVVVLVFDQFASWVFGKYLPVLPPAGFLRRVAEHGAVHHVDFPYAGTLTAPGHASIVTGATPSVHGVTSNERFRGNREVGFVDDGEHEVIGVPGRFASPTALRVESVADVLRTETEGAGKVAAISFKDRAAILTGGRQPDVALFYEKSIPGFTTSQYYEPSGALPAWLASWQDEYRVDAMLGAWRPLDPALYQRVLGPDEQPGEGGDGFDASFPHDARETPNPYSALRRTGLTNEYLLSLASGVVDELDMGRDGTPDLLFVSVSSTDYVGHAFGPESWEYLDNLIRLDRALAEFAAALEARGPVSFLLTADHGVARLAERSNADGQAAHRLRREEVVDAAEEGLDEAFGPGDWVLGYLPPFLYLTESALEHDDAGVVAADALAGHPGVHAAFEAARAPGLRTGADPILRAAALSVGPEPAGEVMVVVAENWVPELSDQPETGTSHGTPWLYDRRVPVLMLGPNVTPVVGLEAGDQRRVAATIAQLLGVRAPEAAMPESLSGVAP